MTDLIRYPIYADTALQYNSSELYSATAEDSTEGAHQVRDLHIKLENILKRDGGGGSVDREIEGFVSEMLRVDVPMQERYRKLDLADLLRKNKNIKGKDGLPFVSAALGILEKYGRNLLKPNRPQQWKTISFSNAVFRTRVDNIKGARDVLCLLGYTEVVEDGVRFPDSMQAPDANVVAMVTSDLILAKAEIEAFSRKSHPHPERVTEAMEGTIAAIQYPPAPTEGGTVYMRQTVQQQRNDANTQDWSGQRSHQASQSSYQPYQASTGSTKQAPPPHAPKPAWMASTQNSALVGQTATVMGNMQNSALVGQSATVSHDSGTSSAGSNDFQCHQRQNTNTQEAALPDQSPAKMCSVCGGTQASQHCQQCDADFCDDCGRKMHLHPKRKNHTLQPLQGGAIRRSPDGSSVVRTPLVEKQTPESSVEPTYPMQPVIKRPDNLNDPQVPLIQHPGISGFQSAAPFSGLNQQPVPTARKRPVPKPRRNIPQTPTSPEREWRPTASLATNVGMQQVESTSSVSPEDPRKIEMEDIMSRDVELLERIASLRDSLKSLPRQSPQHVRMAQMEGDLWNEHKELLQRQAELERLLKDPSTPIQRVHSMMADIRRPPVGDKPLAPGSLLQPAARSSAAPYGRSQSARRPHDQVPTLHPPAEGWECNSCGFLNDDRPTCEGCGFLYGSQGNQYQPRQQGGVANQQPEFPHISNTSQPGTQTQGNAGKIIGGFDEASQVQTAQINQQPSAMKSPSRNTAAQQAKILEAQLPGGMPFGVGMPGQPAAKSKQWSCKYCTFTNTMDITVCQACNNKRERQDVTPAPSSPKFPVQRQQTEGMAARDEKTLTAYEYMQLEEEKMLKEKLAAKAEDEARQNLTASHPPNIAPKPVTSTLRGSPQPPDISPKPINAGASVDTATLLPPVAKRNKSPEARSIGGSESLKLHHLGEGKESDQDGLLSPTSQILVTQERRILAEKANQGLAFVNVLRQAETNGFCVEDVTVASQVIQEQQSNEDIVPWLQQNWDDYKSTATVQATHALSTMQGNQKRIQLSEEEVVEALYKYEGNIEKVVHECIEQRNEKVVMLESYGFETEQAAKAISMCDGDLDKALMKLQATNIDPFYDRLWQSDDDDVILLENLKKVPDDPIEHERYLRLLIAEFTMNSWGRALTAQRLIATDNYGDTMSVITAARECGDYERAKQFLEQECQVCFAQFPHNQLMGLMFCENCLICSECLTDHFRIVIAERNIAHATCPACSKPDVNNTLELAEHFTFLDSLLRPLLDNETHALFLRKLRDWNLQKEENFRWCAHCGNGFINEAPDRRKMRCPECAEITCYECKKPWMEQHEGITCQEFEQWKQDNDPERQAEGVAYHLRENGIGCPQCKMRYELAKGGCMHFKCPQCMFEFCCGCNKPFKNGMECGKLPSCARRGLHSHHPRDCLFHLRDWEAKKLQKLLDKHNIKYDIDPPQNQGQQKGCRVKEQKESPDGLQDGECGREAPAKHAGLCRIHYTEYLVGLINQNLIDPAETFDIKELEIVLTRNEIPAPPRGGGESEQAYQKRLLKEVQDTLPFGDKPPRDRP